MNFRESLLLASSLAKKAGLTVEKFIEAVTVYENATATERSTKDERLSALTALRSFVEDHPDDVPHPRDVVVIVGLKQCQADRAFVRHHLTLLRDQRKV